MFKFISDNEFIALIIGFVGSLILISYQIIIGNFDFFFVYIFSFLIFYIFFLKLAMLYLYRRLRDRLLAFSIAWSVGLIAIFTMGVLGLKFPFWTTIFLGQTLLGITILTGLIKARFISNFLLFRKSLMALLLAIIFFAMGLSNSLPWLNSISKAGIGTHDTFRDAAVLNMWSSYSSITHGIHGLLAEPYHALYVMLYNPFVTSSEDVFKLFIGFSVILIPALLSFGLLNIFEYTSRTSGKSFKLPLLFLFLSSIIIHREKIQPLDAKLQHVIF